MYEVKNGNGEVLGIFKAKDDFEACRKADLFFEGQYKYITEVK